MFALLDRLDRTELTPIIILCLETSKYEWLSLNRGQLHDGQDNTGRLQSPDYADERYAVHKNEENPVPGLGVPDFFVTGDYYNSIQMTVNASQYSITTYSQGVPYGPKLEAKWSRNYGLDPENLGFFSHEIVRPKVVKELVKELGL
jgi:hypothetical protein